MEDRSPRCGGCKGGHVRTAEGARGVWETTRGQQGWKLTRRGTEPPPAGPLAYANEFAFYSERARKLLEGI